MNILHSYCSPSIWSLRWSIQTLQCLLSVQCQLFITKGCYWSHTQSIAHFGDVLLLFLPFGFILNTPFEKCSAFCQKKCFACPAATWHCAEQAVAQSLLFLTAPLKAWNVCEGLAEPWNKGSGNDWIGCGREALSRFNTRATETLEPETGNGVTGWPQCTEPHCWYRVGLLGSLNCSQPCLGKVTLTAPVSN